MLNSLRNVSGGKYGRGRGRIIMEGQPRSELHCQRMMLTPLRTMFSRVRRETGVRENL